MTKIHVSTGPAQREGLGGGGAGFPHFLQKNNNKIKKYTFYNKNYRLADLARASKFMIGPFRSYHMVSLKMTIFTKLHLVVDFCVFTSQVM